MHDLEVASGYTLNHQEAPESVRGRLSRQTHAAHATLLVHEYDFRFDIKSYVLA